MARLGGPCAAIGLVLLVVACKPADRAAVNAQSPAASPAATPQPQPSATPSPVAALGRYAGSYPYEKVGGVAFLDAPAVVGAVDRLVPDEAIRKLVLGGDGPVTPVTAHDGKLTAWGCETHNCGAHNWTIEIGADGSRPAVCYHDAATMHDRSRWYLAPDHAAMRDGDCPSD